jgi:hypothetical protein
MTYSPTAMKRGNYPPLHPPQQSLLGLKPTLAQQPRWQIKGEKVLRFCSGSLTCFWLVWFLSGFYKPVFTAFVLSSVIVFPVMQPTVRRPPGTTARATARKL